MNFVRLFNNILSILSQSNICIQWVTISDERVLNILLNALHTTKFYRTNLTSGGTRFTNFTENQLNTVHAFSTSVSVHFTFTKVDIKWTEKFLFVKLARQPRGRPTPDFFLRPWFGVSTETSRHGNGAKQAASPRAAPRESPWVYRPPGMSKYVPEMSLSVVIVYNSCNVACLKFKLLWLTKLAMYDASTFWGKQCKYDQMHEMHFTGYSGNIFRFGRQDQKPLRNFFSGNNAKTLR